MAQDMKARFAQKMTEAEKQVFAEKFFEAKKNNPDISWIVAFDAGRAAFPDRETIPKQIAHPSSYPWLMRALTALGEQAGHNLFADNRKRKTNITEKKNTILAKQQAKQDNQNLIAQTIHKIRCDHPKLSWKDVFARATELLPEECQRLRKIDGPAQAPWLAKLLNELAQNKEPEIASPETEPARLVSMPVEEPPFIPKEMPLIGTEPPPAIPTGIPVSGMQSLESALILAIVSTIKPLVLNIINSPQFASTLIAAFRDVNPTPMGSSHPIIAEALKPTTANVRPKVLIVGLLGQQAQEIQNEWSKIYDLRIFDSDVTSEKIRSLIPHCDKAILMTKFVSHRAQDAMRGCSGFTYCNGGVSSLKEILNRRNGHSAN